MKSSGNLCCQSDAFLLRASHNSPVIYLKEWREHAGLKQDKLGEALDPPASAGTISSYETGQRKMSQRRLAEIAAILGTTPGKILDEPPPKEGTSVVAMPAELFDIWPRIADRHLTKQAIAMLRVIAESEEDDPDQEQK